MKTPEGLHFMPRACKTALKIPNHRCKNSRRLPSRQWFSEQCKASLCQGKKALEARAVTGRPGSKGSIRTPCKLCGESGQGVGRRVLPLQLCGRTHPCGELRVSQLQAQGHRQRGGSRPWLLACLPGPGPRLPLGCVLISSWSHQRHSRRPSWVFLPTPPNARKAFPPSLGLRRAKHQQGSAAPHGWTAWCCLWLGVSLSARAESSARPGLGTAL